VNPQTGESLQISARRVPRFKGGSRLKRRTAGDGDEEF
jgi:nucleoid DNA-binding protein